MANSLHDTYITGLKNAHALEKQAVQLLSRQLERLENYPDMSAMISTHIQESEVQADRLSSILERHGTSNSMLKDFVTSLSGNMAALAHMPMQDEVLKNTFANYAFEHFEIAAYKSLIALAEATGDTQSIPLLEQSMAEEVKTAKLIEASIEKTTLEYAHREAAGVTAGV
ncbi:MAG TPA: ferritin-like domain-containing protein [Roseococcus sp.]|jgi:ferritin-like metal-binding protein YciE|nr:ferritin-like domain-containing protein [Roseococcus sp.]